MTWCFSWYCIPHVLAHFLGGVLLLVCCMFGQGKNIHLLWCVPLVMRYRIHMNRCVGSSRFFYILSLRLDVTHCNSRTGWFFFAITMVGFYLYRCEGLHFHWHCWVNGYSMVQEFSNNIMESFLITFILFFSWFFLVHNLFILSKDWLGPGVGWILWSFCFLVLVLMEWCTCISCYG